MKLSIKQRLLTTILIGIVNNNLK